MFVKSSGSSVLDRAEHRLIKYAESYAARDDAGNAYAFAALVGHLCEFGKRSGNPDALTALMHDGLFLRRKTSALGRIWPALGDVALALKLVADLHARAAGDSESRVHLREEAIGLMIREEALHEQLEGNARAGGILASALAGKFESALAEAKMLPEPRESAIQIALIAEAAVLAGPEHYASARKALTTLKHLGERAKIMFNNSEEGEFADFVAKAPAGLSSEARGCASIIVRDQAEVDLNCALGEN